MWRDSKQNALRVSEKHSFEDQLHFLCHYLRNHFGIFLSIDKIYDKVTGLLVYNHQEVNQLYIHLNYQRQGIGSRLLNIAKANAHDRLQLYTFEMNKGAREFYEKHGFKIIGQGNDNEEGLPDLLYEWTKI